MIKNYRLFFLLTSTIIFTHTPLAAHTESQELFEKANELYRKQKYKKALSVYRQVPEKGWPVLYNMGNCAYRLNKKGEALANWRRAQKLAPIFGAREVVDNIRLLKEELKQGAKESHGTFLRDMWRACVRLATGIPIGYTQTFLLICLFLLGFLAVNTSYISRISLAVPLVSLNGLLGLFLVIQLFCGMYSYGIVVTTRAQVLSGPNTGFQVLTTLNEAQEVRIRARSHDYFKVDSDGVAGWVAVENIKKI